MGTLVELFPVLRENLRIENIPIRRLPEHDRALFAVCRRLLKHRGSHRVMIVSKHGELVLGVEKIKDVLSYYRTQKEIRAIALVPAGIVDDFMRNY